MKKSIIISVAVLVVSSLALLYYFNNRSLNKTEKTNSLEQSQEQEMLAQTLKISQAYISLRQQTHDTLINAKDVGDYATLNSRVNELIKDWEIFEKNALNLEKTATELAPEKTSSSFINQALAYDLQEANQIINSAPPQRRIATLAKHYGVDAKMAQLILNQTQDMLSNEAYTEEGDVASTYENGAIRIKNGAKVTVFVGTIVATGGTSAFVASGALAQTAVVVSGADLVLEIADDEAKIALGDKNKVSSMIGDVRTVTEPVAGILAIANIPGNVSKAIDKFGIVSLGVDQLRSAVQDKKILGISIEATSNGELKTEITGLTEEELPEWKEENNAPDSSETVEEIIEQALESSVVASEEKKEESKKENTANEARNKKETVKGNLKDTPNQLIKVKNVSGSSCMIDTSFNQKHWDDLAAKPEEGLDVGGIYTLGKVFTNGESFSKHIQVAQFRDSGALVETSANSYKTNLYFAIAPFAGPEHEIIDHGTWQNHSIEINAKYGDEPVIEWDGSSLKQIQ